MVNENEKYIKWEQIFDALGEAVFIADINNNIIKVNKACADMLGMAPEEIIGKKCYALMHNMDKPWPGCPFEKSKMDKKLHADELVNDKNGRFLLVTTSPILSASGEVIGVVHLSKDVTVIKQAEEELRNKIKELERFQRITVDRELKMKELKAKIAELERGKS